jgi:hypothetical protein
MEVGAVSGHDELHRTAARPVRSSGAGYRSAAAGSGCPTWPVSRAPRANTLHPTCAAIWSGAPNAAWTHWLPAARIWSCICDGCRRSAGSSPRPCHGGSQSPPGSTAPVSSTAFWSIHLPSMSAVLKWPPNHRPWASPTCSSRRCSPPRASHPIRATSRWWPCSASLACGSSRPPARTSPTWARSAATGCCACAGRHQNRPGTAATSRRPGHRPGDRRSSRRPDSAQQPRRPHGPPRCHAASETPRRDRRSADYQAASQHAPAHLRHDHARRGRGPAGRPDRRPPCGPENHDAL